MPPRVIISEYIDVAHAFFENDEPRVVNSVLDGLARKLRPGDLPSADVVPGPSPDPGDQRELPFHADCG